MTKDQLIQWYMIWSEKYQLFAYPEEIDSAVSLLSYDSGHSENGYSGTQIFAVTKHKKDKIHMFVFSLRSTWTYENDIDDDAILEEEVYRKILSF